MTPPTLPQGGVSLLASFAMAALTALSPAFAKKGDAPTGKLKLDNNMVVAGSNIGLDWEITYPTDKIDEIIEIVPPNRIRPKKDLKMKVRVLGTAFQNGLTLLPVDIYWSRNGGDWDRMFYGLSTAVNPGTTLLNENVKKNQYLDFGARGWLGTWLPFHHSRSADKWMTVLKNGDTAPNYAPAFNQGTIASFLGPYIDSNGRISIGEQDLIVLWEVYTAGPGSPYFDMQDAVVLLTFE